MPALDRYDPDAMDDEDYDDMSIAERVAAEQALRRRDRDEGYRRGDADLLYGLDKFWIYFYCSYWYSLFFLLILCLIYSSDESDDGETPRKKRKRAERAAAGDLEEDEEVSSAFCLRLVPFNSDL